MSRRATLALTPLLLAFGTGTADGQAAPSVARVWTEAMLFAIREDFARPPVHARNLYHLAGAMYDAWALFDAEAAPLFLDSGTHRACEVSTGERAALVAMDDDAAGALREDVIAQAAWRLIRYRYRDAAGARRIRRHVDELAAHRRLTATGTDRAAVLGAHVADCVIGVGRRDNSNEDDNYTNLAYAAVNEPLDPRVGGNASLRQPSRWQPLAIGSFVDQSGLPSAASEFIGAEWGSVVPFAMQRSDRSLVMRDGQAIPVWHNPGPPPRYESDPVAFARQFAFVALWSGQLDPADETLIDIAPRARTGGLGADDLAIDPMKQLSFYDPEGGQFDAVDALAQPVRHRERRVPRGDFTRVVAEYWADGPDSETPPGHWFSLYNDHVSGNHALVRRAPGGNSLLDALAFDVLAYLALGGAMHDAAIAAWSSKGAYDSVRPISAIRFLADNTRTTLPIVPDRIERIAPGDPLAGLGGAHVGQIKIRAWRGPAAIEDPASDVAGVGWILARDWWPYQRPNFVTPPFAGYVSGHSAFSRAAAEVLERLTGSPFWPGGSAGFIAPADAFLVFEQGPSVDVPLRWATFRDAADQTGLSRIWGGIHPPADDLAGRRVGARVGQDAWRRAVQLFGQRGEHNVATSPPIERGLFSGCATTGSARDGDVAFLLMGGVAGFRIRLRRRAATG